MSTVISSGQTTILKSGKVLSGAFIKGGALIVSAGGRSSGIQIETGSETVLKGGEALGTSVSGGAQIVANGGTASGTVVTNRGQEILSSGGKSIGATLKNGGKEVVSAGGIASGTLVHNGGILVDAASAAVTGAQVANGGTIDLTGGSFSGTIASGGAEVVTSASNHKVYSGLAVKKGVTLTVSALGATSGSVISKGGIEIVGVHGTETKASVLNGGEIVYAGGTITGLMTQSGAMIGVTSGAEIKSQAIGAGVTLLVSGGAVASSITLGSGATENIEFGGTIAGVLTMGANATLNDISTGNAVPLSISGFSKGDTIDLADFEAGVIMSSYTPSVGGAPGGILKVMGMQRTASIHVFGQYVAAGFHVLDQGTSVIVTYAAPPADTGPDLATGGHH